MIRILSRSFFISLLFPLWMGTTYVIMEGEEEVGRYEEPDGLDIIKQIQNPVRKKAPTPRKVMSASEKRIAELKEKKFLKEATFAELYLRKFGFGELLDEYSEKYANSAEVKILREYVWLFKYFVFFFCGLLLVIAVRRKLQP